MVSPVLGFEPGQIPDVPPPDLDDIGKKAGAAFAESGVWEKFWKTLVGIVPEVIAAALAMIVTLLLRLGLQVGKVLVEAERGLDPQFRELAKLGIEDLFDTEVSESAIMTRGAGEAVGKALLDGLLSGSPAAKSGVLEPSDQAAAHYLGTVTQLALEGWVMGWLSEFVTLGAVENWGDLDDTIAQVLGLGRLSRRVLSPAVDTLISTPLEWHYAKAYRPRLLAPAEAVRQFTRGRWTREQLFEELSRQGYSDDRIEALISSQQRFIGPDAIDFLVRRRRWTREQGIQHLRDQGYSQPIAEALLLIERDRQFETVRRSAVTAAESAYIDREIEVPRLRQLLDALSITDDEAAIRIAAAAIRRELNARDLTLGQVEDGVRGGLLNLSDYRRHLEERGYKTDDQRTLELLLLGTIRDREQAQRERDRLAADKKAREAERRAEAERRKAELEARLRDRGLSMSQAETAVKEGLLSLDQYREFLRRQGVVAETEELLVALLEREIAEEAAAERARADKQAAAEADRAARAAERAAAAEERRKERERRIEADRVRREDERKRAEERERERRRKIEEDLARSKISLAQAERAVRRGFQTFEDLRRLLVERGFTRDDADLVIRLLQADLTEDEVREQERIALEQARDEERRAQEAEREAEREARRREAEERRRETEREKARRRREAEERARARREEIEAELARTRLSLSQLERSVLEGILTESQYVDFIRELGYNDTDIELLLLLLQVRLGEEAEKEAAKAAKEAGL